MKSDVGHGKTCSFGIGLSLGTAWRRGAAQVFETRHRGRFTIPARPPTAVRRMATARPGLFLLAARIIMRPRTLMSHAVPSEMIPLTTYPTSAEVNRAVAGEIAALIRAKAAAGTSCVLGLATGSTPVGVYNELIRLQPPGGAQLRQRSSRSIWTSTSRCSRATCRATGGSCRSSLFDHVDLPREAIHIPDGTTAAGATSTGFAATTSSRSPTPGGLDLQLLGIGRTGHVGFNEPGSGKGSRTRLITLDKVTRLDAASDFLRRAVRAAPRHHHGRGHDPVGAADSSWWRSARARPRSSPRPWKARSPRAVAASFLQEHPNSARLPRRRRRPPSSPAPKSPWLVGPVTWDRHDGPQRRHLAGADAEEKPILKLTDEDYNEHGLQDLLAGLGGGSAY